MAFLMRWLEKTAKQGFALIGVLWSSTHGKIILIGLLIGLLYLPAWLKLLVSRAFEGSVSWFLIVTMLGFAGHQLWQHRQELSTTVASEEDQFLGHALIVCAAAIFPFCRFALWPQSLVWLMVLIGMAYSSWGLGFFRRFKLATLLIGLTVYPRLGLLSRAAWEFFFPAYFVENSMAAIATMALNLVNFQAAADGRFINFPEGAVEVGWGCNGIDMAVTMAIAGFFISLMYQQKPRSTLWIMGVAIVLALLANIPRLMLVSVAYVYWGTAWFKFWHGFWGGQLFAGLFSTIYFSLVLEIIKKKPARL